MYSEEEIAQFRKWIKEQNTLATKVAKERGIKMNPRIKAANLK